mgnify:CR=1 FL=1|jgi:hypothetical protein
MENDLIKFLDCDSGFMRSQFYKFKNDLGEFPLEKYNFGFKFSKLQLIAKLEDNIAGLSYINQKSKKDELYDLMCESLGIEKECYLDDSKFNSAIRT